MEKPICKQNHLIFGFLISVIALLVTGCGSSGNNSSTTGSSTTGVSPTTLTISPSTLTLGEGNSYTFTASGGSGNYSFSVPSSEGYMDASNGAYTAPSNWTGTISVEATDVTYGTIATATVTITSGSTFTGTPTPTPTGTPTTTSGSMTGTLGTCAGISTWGYANNWEVNGNELRTINDPNYYYESPVNCTGLTLTGGSIPTDATIQGVSVSLFLINQSSGFDGSILESITLLSSGSVIGTADAVNAYIPGKSATFPTFTQGQLGNNWGASLTPAIVNDRSFGITIQTYRATNRLFLGEAGSIIPQVTIYYTE